MKYGLNPTPIDERDFQLGAITDLPSLSELPDHFLLPGIKIYNQKQTDFCTQFAICGMSELQEGVELAPEWCFAVSKALSGGVDDYGQDIRTALKVHTKHGAPKRTDVPFTVENKDQKFLRRIENYDPTLYEKAIEHAKQTFVKVTGPYDHFDNIRATLWKYRHDKRAVTSGVLFGWSSREKILDEPQGGGGHAIYYAGWTKIDGVTYMIMVNSYGKRAGENGKHYASRKVVNTYTQEYGAYTLIDLDPETVKWLLENGIKDKDNFVIQLMKITVTLLKDLLSLVKKK